jgi:hypothetical protein
LGLLRRGLASANPEFSTLVSIDKPPLVAMLDGVGFEML